MDQDSKRFSKIDSKDEYLSLNDQDFNWLNKVLLYISMGSTGLFLFLTVFFKKQEYLSDHPPFYEPPQTVFRMPQHEVNSARS